jgi:3'-phosphoadenosine 5'-phosphosulfate sulfotransferase (PAPS reductase)/FAD synthetase
MTEKRNPPRAIGFEGDVGIRHILSLSGGKDSAALAIYMRDRVPSMEYIFHDTDKELPETYDYIARLEAILGKPVVKRPLLTPLTIGLRCTEACCLPITVVGVPGC